ncbi:nitrate- and nitrite sensing domain-containing protein [Streptomyces sp. AV19]|uniref:sensor histidine kinase n=1 Tax=Streptomyces sp. AV19 TaxID=2793068 RepID=UPI0018FE7FE1|nr:sensor histidine kinase [Streptomyces sp. AV19]MBH1933943.1 nitrate- and nitrite sensing domain-containing protein [Streptomyces sp. AV19]MDG4535574.1 nitrate- and nitrite sensing domain-containing protein [Streptomyces sp. AV19]
MQGRFKRDGSAAADKEPRGATDRGTSVDAPNGGEPAERPKAKGPSGPGSRIALRNWRISTRLVSLLTLPVVAATTLGALRIEDSLNKVEQLDHMKLLTEMTRTATQLANALQDERDRSAGPLTSLDPKNDDVVASRQTTDRAIKDFVGVTAKVKPGDTTMVGVSTTLVDISNQLKKIKDVRSRAYKKGEYISQTVNEYNRLVTSLHGLSQDMAQASNNADMISAARSLATFSSAKEYASIQRAMISAALAAPGGPRLAENDRQTGHSATYSEDEALTRFTAMRGDADRELLQTLNGGSNDIGSADKYAGEVLTDPKVLRSDPKSYRDWFDQDTVKLREMSKIEDTLLDQMEQKAAELRDDAQQDAIFNAALIVLVLGISLVGAFVVSRSMVRSLRRLQDTAQRVAQDRLPELVKQLSEADPQDVDTSVESVGVHSRDEIGKVASAFDDVHREAVRLAAEQALLRGNVNAMFTNLSRRSQGLIQRQLSLISELESREADPDQLSSLFKLDHLATRMRRNGENLLVLAGEEPGRRWTRPVPLVDVLRAAASEVEQYERIELTGVPATEVAGRVVNDLVHLLAELLENATSFSSPQTKVKVTGHALPDGRVLVEIHDTGIGLSAEDLAAINERLASPPTVDVSVSRRMGLFVVGRLSLRHGIRIQLRPSDSGGTTALVMLPVDVAQGNKKPAPAGVPGMPGMPGMPGLPGGNPPKASPGLPGGGPQSGAPGGALDSAPSRGQLPESGPRPPIPSRTGGKTRSGLPTRVKGSTPGAAAPAGGPSLFDSPNPPSPSDRKAEDGRPALPARGGKRPAVIAPVGKLPKRGGTDAPAGGDGNGLPTRPAPSWGNDKPAAPAAPQPAAPVDDWPLASGSGRAARETPRGHERTGNPAGPASFGTPGLPQAGPGDTGQFARPEPDGQQATTTGQFALPADETARPTDTAQFPQLAPVPEPAPAPSDDPSATGQYPRLAPVPEPESSATGQTALPTDTAQFPQPAPVPEPVTGTPPAGTPLFQELESHWFREETQAPAEPQQQLPRREPSRTLHDTEAADGQNAQADWNESPNDARWRRAEQLREPLAGGTTGSGLPRRVPRANLVEGTAQQQSLPGGPQVSRSPDDVRGRLTNLRRGIQQGRQAGTGPATGSNDNVGPTYQQER